jgi:hypothetical protein
LWLVVYDFNSNFGLIGLSNAYAVH